MNVTGSWRIVSSPDFDDDYLRMEVEPYVELHQRRDRVSGTYIFTDCEEALNHSRMGALLEGDVIGIEHVERHAA
jgi:hypothetical protein